MNLISFFVVVVVIVVFGLVVVVIDNGPTNLPVKFGQNQVRNS